MGTFSLRICPLSSATFPDFVALALLLVMIGEGGQRQDEKEWGVEQELGGRLGWQNEEV